MATGGQSRAAAVDRSYAKLIAQYAHKRTPLRFSKRVELEDRTGDVLVLEQRPPAPVHRAQRCQIRSGDVELLTEVAPQRRRHDADGLEQSPAHAQKSDLQCEPEHSSGPRHSSITRRSAGEKLKNASISKAVSSRGRRLSPRQVVCQLFMLLYPRQGHNNGPKTENSNRLIWLKNPRLPARKPERSYRHFWHQNQGNPNFGPISGTRLQAHRRGRARPAPIAWPPGTGGTGSALPRAWQP